MAEISLNPRIKFACSSIEHGSMSKAVPEAERDNNRHTFLQTHGIKAGDTVLVRLEYEGDDYRRYQIVDTRSKGNGMTQPSRTISDALFTQETGLALILPVADCVAAVLYDSEHRTLGLAHLGRHNLEQNGGEAVINYMIQQFQTDPRTLQVWLGPAAGKASYPLYNFGGDGLIEVSKRQLCAGGVREVNIIADSRDTTTDVTLFSHSEFLKGNRQTDGRQAVVAMMRD